MITIKYTITFYSEWHAGSGLTSGSDLDSLVIKDKNGLPYIPGRTLKGLLREASEELMEYSECSADFIKHVFGQPTSLSEKNDNLIDPEEKEVTEKGNCFFSNATLSEDLVEPVIANHLTSFFYRSISSTAIDGATGVAKKHSLRIMETTIPCTLHAEIINVPKDFEKQIETCLKWVKRLGQNRNRGLGRCKFEIIKKEEAK